MGFILRQIENSYKKVLFSRHDPDDRIFYFSAGDFPTLFCADYSFESKRGHSINGRFYYYNDHLTDRMVVFDHGLAPWHRSYMREIETLCRHGYIVYTFDHTGCGESEGDHIMGLCGSIADLDDCLNALKSVEQLSGMKIMVVGHSRGGYSTVNIPALHPEVDRIVAISAFTSLRQMQKQITPLVLAPFRNHLFALEREANPEYVDLCAIKTLSACDTPALLIHSNDDKTVSCKANFLKLKSALADRPNTEFLLLNDRDHNPTYTESAVKYKKAFFKELNRVKKLQKKAPTVQTPNLIARYDWRKMTEQDEDVWENLFEFLDK